MQVFKGLLLKEFRLTKNWFLSGLIVLLLCELAGWILAQYFGEPDIFSVITIMILFLHAVYLLVYMLSSLAIEARTQLWLHNPNSGTMLFLAKLVTGIIFFLSSFMIAVFISVWGIHYSGSSISLSNTQHILSFLSIYNIGGGIIITSIMTGILVLPYWSFFHSLKKFPLINKLRWPITILSLLIFTKIASLLDDVAIIQKLRSLWVIEIPSANPIVINIDHFSLEASMAEGVHISIISGMMDIAVLGCLFFLAVWLLDRKVEV